MCVCVVRSTHISPPIERAPQVFKESLGNELGFTYSPIEENIQCVRSFAVIWVMVFPKGVPQHVQVPKDSSYLTLLSKQLLQL